MVDPRVGRRGFLGIRPRRWWLRPRGGHAHGKRGARVVGDGDGNRHREDGEDASMRSEDEPPAWTATGTFPRLRR